MTDKTTILQLKLWNISMTRHLRECSRVARRYIENMIDENLAIISSLELN